MKVYVDHMLVKSLKAVDHIEHLSEAFGILQKYNMKPNPLKCSFGVSSGQFLGYLITRRGIKVKSIQLEGVVKILTPTNKKDIQSLTGRIASLNRFLP